MLQQQTRTNSRGEVYVIGPTGAPLTKNDLPPPNTGRWVIRRKAEVVAAVRGGLITLEEALERYSLTNDEFVSWQRSIERHGMAHRSRRAAVGRRIDAARLRPPRRGRRRRPADRIRPRHRRAQSATRQSVPGRYRQCRAPRAGSDSRRPVRARRIAAAHRSRSGVLNDQVRPYPKAPTASFKG